MYKLNESISLDVLQTFEHPKIIIVFWFKKMSTFIFYFNFIFEKKTKNIKKNEE